LNDFGEEGRVLMEKKIVAGLFKARTAKNYVESTQNSERAHVEIAVMEYLTIAPNL
jgi:hypothetical protein